MDDRQMMLKCIELAKGGYGHVEPNPLVGCVIVKNDRIIAQGYHARYGELHAEANALKNAGGAAKGATLVVNLEPCCHHGKTPPCVDAIIEAGIKRVVIGLQDPNPKMAGKGAMILRRAGIQVTERVETEACEKLNEVYLHALRTKMPFVTYKYAMTLDGHQSIGRKTQLKNERHLTCKKSDDYVQALRHRNGAIIIGAGTVQTDNPLLTDRSQLLPVSHPVRVIIGHDAATLLNTQIFNTAKDIPTIFATTDDTTTHLAALENAKITVWRYPFKSVPVDTLLSDLHKEGIQSVLLEGGRQTASAFLAAQTVQKLEVFITPRMLAKNINLGLPLTDMTASMASAYLISQMAVQMRGEDVHITAYL